MIERKNQIVCINFLLLFVFVIFYRFVRRMFLLFKKGIN